jgi:hypothetical protein
MSRREKASLQVAIGLTAFLVVAVQSGTVTATTNGVELEQTIGTVNAVDPNARRISVITGCGHAVRVMVFYAGTACRIEVEGAIAPMTNSVVATSSRCATGTRRSRTPRRASRHSPPRSPGGRGETRRRRLDCGGWARGDRIDSRCLCATTRTRCAPERTDARATGAPRRSKRPSGSTEARGRARGGDSRRFPRSSWRRCWSSCVHCDAESWERTWDASASSSLSTSET